MSASGDRQQARRVRRMFGRIARRYDLLNRLMTFGQDLRWRRQTVRRLEIAPGARILDVGAGTGDLAFEALRQCPSARPVACDFSPEMLAVARARPSAGRVSWLLADARRLPFAAGSFDGALSGFLLRNLPRVEHALAEQRRVLTDGGRLAALDTTPPRPGPLRPLVGFHLRVVIPLLGRLVAGDAEAYRYLPESTVEFLEAEELAARMEAAGFAGVGFARRMLGTIAIHWGVKAA